MAGPLLPQELQDMLEAVAGEHLQELSIMTSPLAAETIQMILTRAPGLKSLTVRLEGVVDAEGVRTTPSDIFPFNKVFFISNSCPSLPH